MASSTESQSQLMDMVLANQAVMKGKIVQVLLCCPGGDLALREGKELSPTMLHLLTSWKGGVPCRSFATPLPY